MSIDLQEIIEKEIQTIRFSYEQWSYLMQLINKEPEGLKLNHDTGEDGI